MIDLRNKYVIGLVGILLFVLTACTIPIEDTNVTTETTTNIPNPVLTGDCVEKTGFVLTFCDSFNADSEQVNEYGVDLDKWGFQLGTGSQYGLTNWGNNEQQYYLERNARVENGNLVIDAKKETFLGRSYTSARLFTKDTFSQKYGRFEASIKLPAGNGFWPAFWLLPKDSVYGSWPLSGEIDIMEARGRITNEIDGTIHFGSAWPNNSYVGAKYYFPVEQNIMQFHEYAVEWEPGEIRWYVDGKLFQTLNNWYSEGNPYPAPFDQEFYIVLNLAIGGNYDNQIKPTDDLLPATMEVEYVRVYNFTYEDDITSPSSISNLSVSSNLPENTTIEWDKATDNTVIRGYDIYLNDEFVGTTSSTNYTLTDLSIEGNYVVSVVAVDMAGNESLAEHLTLNIGYPGVNDIIEAEHYIDMNGIQLEVTLDTGGGQNVGYIDRNDYMLYKVNVSERGTYQINYRVASETNGGAISLFVDDQLMNDLEFNATGGWQNWSDATSSTFTLEAGIHTIKLIATKDGFNVNWFKIITV